MIQCKSIIAILCNGETILQNVYCTEWKRKDKAKCDDIILKREKQDLLDITCQAADKNNLN